jgi:SpoVK/Ycf46/Vps4 family AAA+-type ATPase
VDAFLTKRGTSSEHEATLQAKTEFMQLWDGMESASGMRVLVMGATNRPWMVDDAVLRWERGRASAILC